MKKNSIYIFDQGKYFLTSAELMKNFLSTLSFFVIFTLICPAQAFLSAQSAIHSQANRYPYHHEIIRHLELAAEQYPDRTRKIQYGTSYEGRPLMGIIIASEENWPRLENIRTNHLKSLGILEGKSSGDGPAIAWMSYNVHGNEPSGSSAFMKVLTDLLDPENTTSQKILKNTIVILDPCLNPDGYERYVHWYNQRKGHQPNPTPYAWEHREPWPGGRYNHYLFDLNRDWAWQSQKESQERLLFYQQWMPHLHADFHEMNAASSYYFPPAAKPFHQDITSWQREFNDILGEYNSKEFDKNGWLYFTRFSFDLFYPSYGDTWPIYNGAIGMTFEQAGGGSAGLTLSRPNEGDTLLLKDRIAHHVTTSFATLTALSDHAEKTVSELINYHQNAIKKPIGAYKSYLIKNQPNGGSTRALLQLLDRQGIRYGSPGKPTKTNGVNLLNQQNETVDMDQQDIVISAFQPKSRLLKILFEPDPELEDSLTYDITTWGVSYAYGVRAYGLNSKTEINDYQPVSVRNTIQNHPYAYLIPWKSYESLQLLTVLLRENIKVRTSNQAFRMGENYFDKGTLIVTRKGNETHEERLKELLIRKADSLQVKVTPTTTGYVTEGLDIGSHAVVPIQPPKIAILAGHTTTPSALGEVWHFFEEQIRYPVTLVDGNDIRQVPWHQIDVFILPSGNHQALFTDGELLKLKSWIQAGGKLIIMENAIHSFLGKNEFSIAQKTEKYRSHTTTSPAQKQYGNQLRDIVSDETPGSIFEVTTDPTHPLSFGYNSTFYSLIRQNHQLGYLSEGWNVGWLEKESHKAGFVGSKISNQLLETLILGSQQMGKGQIIYMANNPLFRGFWYHGALLFGNAVFR